MTNRGLIDVAILIALGTVVYGSLIVRRVKADNVASRTELWCNGLPGGWLRIEAGTVVTFENGCVRVVYPKGKRPPKPGSAHV